MKLEWVGSNSTAFYILITNSQYDQNVTLNMRLQLIDSKNSYHMIYLLAQLIHYSDILCTFSKLRIYCRKTSLKVFRILRVSNDVFMKSYPRDQDKKKKNKQTKKTID